MFAIWNRNLFLIGVSVGGQISELLALTLGDVWQNGQPVTDLLLTCGIVKGGEISRTVTVNTERIVIKSHPKPHSFQDILDEELVMQLIRRDYTRENINGELK